MLRRQPALAMSLTVQVTGSVVLVVDFSVRLGSHCSVFGFGMMFQSCSLTGFSSCKTGSNMVLKWMKGLTIL